MNPVFVRRGFYAATASGFIAPGSMLDNTFVLDSFVAATNNAARRPPRNNNSPRNNNNVRLFSSQVATTRNVGPRRGGVRIVDDTILLFDNNSYSIANNTMGGHSNSPPQHDFINLDEIATTEFSKTDDPESTCPICLCDMSTDSTAVQIRRCSHVFHRDCIQKWIGVKRTCPLCRINF